MKGTRPFVSLLFPLLFPGILYLGSCSFAEEFKHMEPPTVISCVPDHQYLKASEMKEIRLRFSTAMDQRSTEEAFSLKANTTLKAGTFQWEEGGRTLVFTPQAPLLDRGTYTLTLSTSAEDRWGNSLKAEFNRTFLTKEETEPPKVVASSPPSGGKVTNLRNPIEITFSEPMDRESIIRSFSVLPSLPGAFTFSSDSASFLWTPLEPYRKGETYQITVKKDSQDLSGNSLVEEYRFSFEVPDTVPEILSITCLSTGSPLTPAQPGTYVDPSLRIEKNESFRILFTSPVDPENRDSIVTFYPTTVYRTAWNQAGNELILTFPEPLSWNTVYELQILSSTFRFRVNGPRSIPLEVRKIFYIPDTTAVTPTYEELLLSHNYTFTDSANAAFDVYLSLSPAGSIVTSSFLSSFSLEPGNGCLDIRLLRVEENPLLPPPQPYPPPQEGGTPLKVQVFRVHCRLTPVFNSGTVTFTLGTDLKDDLENHLAQPYTLVVNKQ